MTIDALKRIPLWQGLDDAILRELQPALRVLAAPKGTEVVAQGDPTRGVFFVMEGLFSFSRVGDRGDEPLVFAVAHPGDFFGERSVIDSSPYSATVTALRESMLMHLPRQEAERVFFSVPEVARRVMQHLSGLVGEMNLARNRLTQRRAGPRLMDTLRQLALPVDGKDGVLRIDVLPGQHSLAQLSGLQRETVSRLLSNWVRGEQVVRDGKSLLLLKVPDEAEL